jgi:diguanylate cyclase (GGDEF)-like protein
MVGGMRSAGRLTFLVGGGVVLLAWLINLLGGVPSVYNPIMPLLAEILAVVSLILALRFRRSRLAIAALLLALVNLLMRSQLGTEPWAHPGFALLAVALPLNLGVLAFLRDRPLMHARSLVHIGIILVQPWLVVGLLYLGNQAPALPTTATPAWLEILSTPQTPLLAFLIAVVFTLLALALRKGAFEGSLLWVLAASGLVVFRAEGVGQATLLLTAAQLALLVGLVEDSYRLAFHDELTGLPSRRALNEAMRSLSGDFALAMVDVDHFKKFNDRYGHDAGDQALKMVAEELSRVGGGGRAYRYGGEEFSVVFTGKSPDHARQPLEDLRSAIEAKRFAVRAQTRPRRKPKRNRKPQDAVQHVTITVSMGVAGPTSRRPTPDDVLKAADKALYKAKKGGRNRLVKG